MIIDCVEGRISYFQMKEIFSSDAELLKWFEEKMQGVYYCYEKATPENDYHPKEIPFTIQHWIEGEHNVEGSIGFLLNFNGMMRRFMKYNYPEVEVHEDTTIDKMFDLLQDACPEYIDGPEVWNSGILERILNECEPDWKKTKKVKYVKERIKEEFHLEGRKYPRWIQQPDWPFSNGKPMKYVNTTVKYKSEWYQHHFIDVESGEERIVDDMY